MRLVRGLGRIRLRCAHLSCWKEKDDSDLRGPLHSTVPYWIMEGYDIRYVSNDYKLYIGLKEYCY
jgi:hypothetical protein